MVMVMVMMIMKKNKIINKKAEGIKKCVIKCRLMFDNYKDCLFNDKTILRSQQSFKSYHHKVYTDEVNKIALSSDDENRLQTFDRVTTYPYGTNAFKLCKNEMLHICKAKDILLSKYCENELYVTCNIFLKYIEANCKSRVKRYVKIKQKITQSWF